MGEFRYKGVSVQGEREDGDGNIIPNIVETTELFGHTFNKRTYTEVPEDEIAYYAWVMNPETGARVRKPCLVVDKLRGNQHFVERQADDKEEAA